MSIRKASGKTLQKAVIRIATAVSVEQQFISRIFSLM